MRIARIVLVVVGVWGMVSVASAAELVLEWKFDGNLSDTSGNNIHGNAFPSGVDPVFGAGVSGQALVSNGSRCAFKTGIDTSILPVLAEDTWSVNVWVYPTEMPQDWRIIWCMGQRPEASNSRALYSSGFESTEGEGSITFVGATTPSGGTRTTHFIATHMPWQVNQWQMLTTTYDGSIVRVYLNGVLIGMRAIAFADAPGEVRIPMSLYGTIGEYFVGKLDEFTIWRGVLSVSDIQDLIIPGVIDEVELNQQIIYYKMDDPNSFEPGSFDPTTLTDFSGRDNHGEYIGFTPPLPDWFKVGFRNEALWFDGGQAVLPPIAVSQPVNYTISFWFRTGPQSYQTALYSEKQVDDMPGNYGKGSQLVIRTNNTDFQVFSKERDYNDLFSFSADGTDYLTGQWHHLTLVADGEAAEARLYIDGNLLASGAYERSSHKTSGMESAIGLSLPGLGNRFIGFGDWSAAHFDEFKIWNGALTEAQVKAVAAKGNFHNNFRVDLDDFAVLAADWLEDFFVLDVIDDMEGTLSNWDIHVSSTYSGTGTLSQTSNAYAGNSALRWEYELPATATGSNYTSFYYDFGSSQDLSAYDTLSLQLYRHAGNSSENLMYLKFINTAQEELAEAWITGMDSVSEPADEWDRWLVDLNDLRGPQGSGTADRSDLVDVRRILIGTGSEGNTDARSGTIDFDEIILEALPKRPLGDLDFDGKVDIEDLQLFADDWLIGMD